MGTVHFGTLRIDLSDDAVSSAVQPKDHLETIAYVTYIWTRFATSRQCGLYSELGKVRSLELLNAQKTYIARGIQSSEPEVRN